MLENGACRCQAISDSNHFAYVGLLFFTLIKERLGIENSQKLLQMGNLPYLNQI